MWSYSVARSFGLPECPSQLADALRKITATNLLPVLPLTDVAFGNTMHVTWPVRPWLDAGSEGVLFEDQVDPKRVKQDVSTKTRVLAACNAPGKWKMSTDR